MLTNNPIGLDILSFDEEILFGTALTNFSVTSRKINISVTVSKFGIKFFRLVNDVSKTVLNK